MCRPMPKFCSTTGPSSTAAGSCPPGPACGSAAGGSRRSARTWARLVREPVDLAGGTLLPGFIDAHAHPVFAGRPTAALRPGFRARPGRLPGHRRRYASDHPDEEWITGGGWAMAAFPGGIPAQGPLDAVGAGPARVSAQPGRPRRVGQQPGAAAGGHRRADTDPPDGRIERDADGEPAGMLQEGAAALVSRLLPAVTDEDWYAGAARRAGLPAVAGRSPAGRTRSSAARTARPTRLTPTCGRQQPGTLLANVVGALWWDRDRGLEQLPGLLERRRVGQAGFRATSVKMMLDGVAENHTAAMLEPYLDDDGCSTEPVRTGLHRPR